MDENEITYKIRGAAFRIYNTLGPGLLESVYEKVMIYELEKAGLLVESQVQVQVPIFYDGHYFGSDLRSDIVVENKVIVELKSVSEMRDVYFKQLHTYLKLTNMKVGLLINFGKEDIAKNIHRIINGYL